LASKGELITGIVNLSQYRHAAPEGWSMYYSFVLKDGKEYNGMSMGPKDYIKKYPKGSQVTIVFLPSNPEINLELFYLANSPDYRRVRKTLFNNPKFKEKLKGISHYDYSKREWCAEIREDRPGW
jgi:hypothetical protein